MEETIFSRFGTKELVVVLMIIFLHKKGTPV
jgi:hypothetical protein